MKFRKTASLLTLAALFILAGAVAAQAYVYVPEANFEGYRITDYSSSQISAYDDWRHSDQGFKISWDIDFNAAECEYTYKYAITDKNGSGLYPYLKIFYLQVSPDASSTDFSDVYPTSGFQGVKDIDVSGTSVDLHALAWEYTSGVSTLCIEFDTDRMPVWGSFYAKDGTYSYAHNAGFNPTLPDGTCDITKFIPVPDTQCVPVPPSLLLLGSGLLGLGVLRFRKG